MLIKTSDGWSEQVIGVYQTASTASIPMLRVALVPAAPAGCYAIKSVPVNVVRSGDMQQIINAGLSDRALDGRPYRFSVETLKEAGQKLLAAMHNNPSVNVYASLNELLCNSFFPFDVREEYFLDSAIQISSAGVSSTHQNVLVPDSFDNWRSWNEHVAGISWKFPCWGGGSNKLVAVVIPSSAEMGEDISVGRVKPFSLNALDRHGRKVLNSCTVAYAQELLNIACMNDAEQSKLPGQRIFDNVPDLLRHTAIPFRDLKRMRPGIRPYIPPFNDSLALRCAPPLD